MTREWREATPAERADWDALVRRFPGHRIEHTRAWTDSLTASGVGRPLPLVYASNGDVAACLPGLLVRLGPLRLYGSPLPGWQTGSMGPVFDPQAVNTQELIGNLLPFLERQVGVDHVELLSPQLDPAAMSALGFRGESVPTFRAPLYPNDEDRLRRALKDSARRNIQRAQRLGLEVRFETDESFVPEHYAQLREVYLRGGHAIPFGERRVRECFRALRDSGSLLAASVLLGDGRTCIATGLFAVEGRELLLWSWAHHTHYRWYRATEYLTWAVMTRAMAAGCDTFDLMGLGDFKTKFGAVLDESKVRWVRSRAPWLTRLRDTAQRVHGWQQGLRGRLRRTAPESSARSAAVACVMGDIDLVRPLGLAGIPCVAVAPPGAPERYSRFTRAVLPEADSWDRPQELLDTLVRFGASQPEPPVLYYETDGQLLFVSRHRETLGHLFRFVVPEAVLAEDLVDKARFQTLAARARLPVPAARCLRPATEPLPDDLGFGYPCIVKPLTRRSSRWSGVGGHSKAVRVEDAAELRALWPRMAATDMTVLAQELVPGPETAIESYHVYVDGQGRIAGEFGGRKIRTWPVQFGHSTALETTDAADVLDLGRELVKRLKLRGVAKFDFKRGPDQDGRLYLLEVNARFNLWHHLGAAAGVNLPALVYADLVGQPRPEGGGGPARPGVRWCKPWDDVRAARAAGIPLLKWLRWAWSCETKRAIAWNDPLPILRGALWAMRHGRNH